MLNVSELEQDYPEAGQRELQWFSTLNWSIADGDLPTTITSICASAAGDRKMGVDLGNSIRAYLSQYGEPIAFNCLMLVRGLCRDQCAPP